VCVVGAPSGELPTGRRRGVRRRRSSRATSAAALRCTLTSICGEKRASRGRKRVSRGKRREQSVGTRHPPCGPVAGPEERRIAPRCAGLRCGERARPHVGAPASNGAPRRAARVTAALGPPARGGPRGGEVRRPGGRAPGRCGAPVLPDRAPRGLRAAGAPRDEPARGRPVCARGPFRSAACVPGDV